MLRVDLDNILTEEDALGRIKEIFDHVENNKETYVVTKGGRPVFAIADIALLEKDGDMEASPSTPTPTEAPVMPVPTPPSMPEPSLTPPPMPEIPTLETPQTPEPSLQTPPTPPAAQAPENRAAASDALDLPNMPEDPSNTSPLA